LHAVVCGCVVPFSILDGLTELGRDDFAVLIFAWSSLYDGTARRQMLGWRLFSVVNRRVNLGGRHNLEVRAGLNLHDSR